MNINFSWLRHRIVRFTVTIIRVTESTNLTSSIAIWKYNVLLKILLLLLRVKTMLLLLALIIGTNLKTRLSSYT